MGQAVTIAMQGTLQLSIDGSPSKRPLEVKVGDMSLDLDYLMEKGLLRVRPDGKAEIELSGLTFTLVIDSQEVLSRGSAAIVAGLEEKLRE